MITRAERMIDMKKTIDLTEFWLSLADNEEHDYEMNKIELAINSFIEGATVVCYEGLALRGVAHITVGPWLDLMYRDKDGHVLAEDYSRMSAHDDLLVLDAYDDGIERIVTIHTEAA